METKVLNTNSELRKTSTLISLFTYYVKEFFLKAFISETDKIENKVEFKQGEEGFTVGGYTDISFVINSDGELVIESNNDKNFYIDSTGALIMEIL